jgi:hypothetical protein
MSGFRQAVQELLRAIATNEASRYTTPWRHVRSEVDERAIQLLVENLSASQREQYEAYRYFDVVGGDTGKQYRIRHGYQMNVEELDQKGRRVRLLCFMPKGNVPIGDMMLAQKIALELFEPDALRVANRLPVWNDRSIAEVRFVCRNLRF